MLHPLRLAMRTFGIKGRTMEGRNFEVSIISTVTSGNKMDGDFMEDWLNRNFRLADYGPGVEEMFILFQAEKEEKPPHYLFHPEEQFLELTVPIQESGLRDASREATIIRMAVALARALKTIPARALEPFGLEAFRHEVEEMIE